MNRTQKIIAAAVSLLSFPAYWLISDFRTAAILLGEQLMAFYFCKAKTLAIYGITFLPSVIICAFGILGGEFFTKTSLSCAVSVFALVVLTSRAPFGNQRKTTQSWLFAAIIFVQNAFLAACLFVS